MITGMPGSGTRVFSRLASRAGLFMGSDLNVEGDSGSYGRFELAWARRYVRARRRGELPADFTQMQEDFLAEQAHHLSGLEDRSARWGWKQPSSMYLVPFHLDAHPGARMVHVFRDGRDFAFRKEGVIRREDLYLSAADLAQPIHIRRVLLWARMNTLVADHARRELGPRYLAVRLEELVASPEATIRRFLDFAGVPGAPTPEMLAEVQPAASLGCWRRFEPGLAEVVTTAASSSLRRFGYLT